MATLYKTPGVYVEEIPKFPPSIAPVETAVPAFIGYTEKAIRNGESLTNIATKIESIADYEELFGGGPSQDVVVYLDTNNNFVKGEAGSALYLYDSLRLFYANGGGKAYIISVGKYPASNSGILQADISLGLAALAKEDEPTIILLPDAVSIGSGGLFSLQQEALAQCAKLQDRVAVLDLEKATVYSDFDAKVKAFRTGVGINALKYGAAYSPWINTNIPRQIWLRNLHLKRDGIGTDILLESLTTDTDVLNLIADIHLSETGGTSLKSGITSYVNTVTGTTGKTLTDALQKSLDEYRLTTSASTPAQLSVALQRFTDLTWAVLKTVRAINTVAYPLGTQFKIKEAITSYLADPALKASLLLLASHHVKVDTDKTIEPINTANADYLPSLLLLDPLYVDSATFLAAATPDVTALYATLTTDKQFSDVAFEAVYAVANNAITFYNSLRNTITEFEKNLNSTLVSSFGKFKELSAKGAEALNLLPPSGAVAGVYAKTDTERGVWKAPANVSLNAVISPAVKISPEQQAEYNVDVNAGKSINIIRAFTGKGTLIWGARTLAGNDNEWRYVNVRRFFNFVEESIKKATEQFVFEPNDANTWVKVQAMNENFLTTLWRQGALQGIKPEHAFYVAVGLGKTMTALDILEGRLIIEIGLAAVRPAEFIILKFSHKLAES